MNSVEFLDAVRAKHGLESDNKLARHLGIERARISAYRCGRRKLDADAAVAVAQALELPAEYVLASVQAERAKRTEHRRLWERLAKMAKHAGAAAVVGFIASTSTPVPSHATEPARALYILLTRRRWRLTPATGGRGGGHDRRQRIAALTRLDRRHHDRRRGHSGRRSQIVARSV